MIIQKTRKYEKLKQLAFLNSQILTRKLELATRKFQLATRNSQNQLAHYNSQLANFNSQLYEFCLQILICKYSLSCDLKLSDFNIFSFEKKKKKKKPKKKKKDFEKYNLYI